MHYGYMRKWYNRYALLLQKRGPGTMSKNVDVNFDYRRAVLLLKNRINTPMDLIKIWAFCGPFHGDCPEIEKIPKSS